MARKILRKKINPHDKVVDRPSVKRKYLKPPNQWESHDYQNEELAEAMSVLTPKEGVFVREYLIDLNARRAAQAAGYSKTSAAVIANKDLLKKPAVIKAIQVAMDLRAEHLGINAAWVLGKIKKVAQICLGETPYGYKVEKSKDEGDKEKEEDIPLYKFDSTGANKSLELLGKHLVIFTEKHRHEIEGNVKIGTDMTAKEAASAYMAMVKGGK